MSKFLTTAIIIILAVSTGYFAYKYYTCKSSNIKMASAPSLPSSLDVPLVDNYKDTAGIQHVVIDSKINSIIERESTKKASELKPIIDNVAQTIGVQSKQVESSTTISTHVFQDSIIALNKIIDSIHKSETYNYKDKNLTLSFTKDSADKGMFAFGYDADLNINQYWKKKWFLGAKKSYTDISSNDPRVTIKGVKKFTVIQKEPEFGARLQLYALHNFSTNAYTLGPSLRVDAFKGSIRATYYYNFQTKQWMPTIAIEKDLIRF